MCALAADPVGGTWYCATGFFTCWVLLIHLASMGSPWPRVAASMRLWLAAFVSIGGAYIVYVYPRQLSLRFPDVTIVIRGPALWTIDILFHQLPLLMIVIGGAWWTTSAGQRPSPPRRVTVADGGLSAALLFVGLFLLVHDPRAVYGLRTSDVVLLFVVTGVLCVSW